jgi:hypothetical protein
MTALPIPAQPTELRRAADQLDARAEVAERQALSADEASRRAARARAFELHTLATLKRGQADAIDARQVTA